MWHDVRRFLKRVTEVLVLASCFKFWSFTLTTKRQISKIQNSKNKKPQKVKQIHENKILSIIRQYGVITLKSSQKNNNNNFHTYKTQNLMCKKTILASTNVL